MDGNLALIFGLVLAAMWIIFRSLRRRDRAYSHNKPDTKTEAKANGELLTQLAKFEGRIQVLERIITDDPLELRTQFRELGG